MPRKVFVAGEILTASDVNTNLMDQSVMVFDDDAARTTAIPTPVEGMVTYLKDTNLVQAFTGSAFTAVGGILQVVSTTKTDTFSASVDNGASVDVTGLTATITPSSATSKVLIFTNVSMSITTGGRFHNAYFLKRDSTAIGIGDAAGSRTRNSVTSRVNNADGNSTANAGFTFLDSPATTSAITYSVAAQNLQLGGTTTILINRSDLDGDLSATNRSASSITLMEVAG